MKLKVFVPKDKSGNEESRCVSLPTTHFLPRREGLGRLAEV